MACIQSLKTPKLSLIVVRIEQFRSGIELTEAILLGFVAENSLSYSVVPKVIELSKEFARDPAALDRLSMDRTTASYKLRFGLAKSMNESTLEAIRSTFFLLI